VNGEKLSDVTLTRHAPIISLAALAALRFTPSSTVPHSVSPKLKHSFCGVALVRAANRIPLGPPAVPMSSG
jgi:hypothetical protein